MMKINQKLLSIAVLAAIFGLASCNHDDDNGGNLSKDQATAKLDQFNTTAVSDLQDLSGANGVTAVKDLMNLVDTDDPFSRVGADKNSIRQFFRDKGKDFKTIFIPKSLSGRTEQDPFVYDNNKGVYTWDANTSTFVKTGESTIISILFPAGNSTTNNAELQITAYTEKEFYDADSQEYYYNPEVLKAALSVDQVKVASIDLSITWSDDAFPVTANVTLFVNPFTANLSFSGTTSSSTLTTSLNKGDKTIVATSVVVKFDNETKDGANLNSINGYVQLENVKIQGSVDVKSADASQSGDPNDYVHLAFYADNKKVGDVIFVNEVVNDTAEFVPYIKYNDGSKEKLEDKLKPVIDEIKSLVN